MLLFSKKKSRKISIFFERSPIWIYLCLTGNSLVANRTIKSPECFNIITQFWSWQCLAHIFVNIDHFHFCLPLIFLILPDFDVTGTDRKLSLRAFDPYRFRQNRAVLSKIWAKQKWKWSAFYPNDFYGLQKVWKLVRNVRPDRLKINKNKKHK